MKWLSSGRQAVGRTALRRVGTVAIGLLVALVAGNASAGRAWDLEILTVQELQDGAGFSSGSGAVAFSDFEFTAIGFDESAFDEYLVQPRDDGFRLILGFGDLFGPGTLAMRYTATAASGLALDGAGIPFLALLEAIGASPLLEVEWSGDNGASLFGSSSNTEDFPWPGVSTRFDPVASVVVEQLITLSGGSGIAKVENSFRVVKVVPEPATAALLALAFVGAVAAGRRDR